MPQRNSLVKLNTGAAGYCWNRKIGVLIPLQLPLQCVFSRLGLALNVTVKGSRPSTVLNGASENPRGYNDPNPEAEKLQKDSPKNGNSGRQVASPAKAAPCGNERCKSKTKRCHEDHEKQVAAKINIA
jgi:hypothetical protein